MTGEQRPSEIGDSLRRIRDGRGWSVDVFAAKMGVNKNTVGAYERGERLPEVDYLARFAKETDSNFAELLGLRLQAVPGLGSADIEAATDNAIPNFDDFVLVPRYDIRASAGHGAVVSSEQIVDHLAFRKEWVRNALGVAQKDLALITVKGDSMEPTLSNGDLILIDMHASSIGDNAIYVLRNDGQLLVKRVQRKLDGTIIIKSDNTAYDPETVDAKHAGKLKVVGRVVWAGRRL